MGAIRYDVVCGCPKKPTHGVMLTKPTPPHSILEVLCALRRRGRDRVSEKSWTSSSRGPVGPWAQGCQEKVGLELGCAQEQAVRVQPLRLTGSGGARFFLLGEAAATFSGSAVGCIDRALAKFAALCGRGSSDRLAKEATNLVVVCPHSRSALSQPLPAALILFVGQRSARSRPTWSPSRCGQRIA